MTFGWLDLGCPQEAYFHAGDVQTHVEPHPDHPDDDLLDPRAMRTIVFTALLVRLPDDAKLAESSSDGPHEHASAGEGTWWTLDQLAAAAACPAGTARYRACAAAIAKVDSYTCSPRATRHTSSGGACDPKLTPTAPPRSTPRPPHCKATLSVTPSVTLKTLCNELHPSYTPVTLV